jgi:UDP-2,4-diacetamido-2,4,6-trideoxy-beta-L-altropyranose hydrolase
MAVLALFRCDGSPTIGAGHVTRCLSVAQFLSRAGWSCVFVTNAEAGATVPAMLTSGFPIRTTSGLYDLRPFTADAALVVVDHYGLDFTFERQLCADGRTVVVFDDLADRRHACDILVDPTPGRTAHDYQKFVPASTHLLLGAKHAMIGPGWRAQGKASRVRIAECGPVRRILVSMGATDPSDATSRVLTSIVASGVDSAVDVVLGAGAPHRAAVKARLESNMALHVEPSDLPEIAARADMAIGAAGASSLERAVLGLPMLLVPTADNQRFISAGFRNAGAAELVPVEELDAPLLFGARIAALVTDGKRRAMMSRAASSLTDGRGPAQLLAAIAGLRTSRNGRTLRLRLAEHGDEGWLLALQRQPETRWFARKPAAPAESEHTRWLVDVLDDDDRLLFIVMADEVPVGMVRLDRTVRANASFEISIAIDARYHQQGFGRAALSLVRRLAPAVDLIATVLPENRPSRALFAAAGYRVDRDGRYVSPRNDRFI